MNIVTITLHVEKTDVIQLSKCEMKALKHHRKGFKNRLSGLILVVPTSGCTAHTALYRPVVI
jgi:hypothetical protein